MGLFSKLFGKKPKPVVNEPNQLSPQQVQQVVQIMRNRFRKPVIRIETTEGESLDPLSSKFGGYGYWTQDLPYPTSSQGEPLLLLAQINFQREQLPSELLPKEGLLQFYITPDDPYGLHLTEGTKQDTFRVVYHPALPQNMTLEEAKAAGAKANTELDQHVDAFPFYKEYSLRFSESEDFISACDEHFEDELQAALEDVLGHAIPARPYKFLTRDDYGQISNAISFEGSKMLGAPSFTQWDPRHEGDGFDTLLLQIDSEIKKDILWGDCGVANFFINSEALKKCDFTTVLYNWDCC